MQSLFERAFIEPFRRLNDQFAEVLPPLILVLMLLIVGGAVAYLVRQLVFRILTWARFNRLVDRTGLGSIIMSTQAFSSPADFGARVAQGFVWLFIVLLALNAVNTEVTGTLIVRLVNYIPAIITAILVLLLGSVVANFLARSVLLAAVNAQWATARLLSGLVKTMVMLLAAVIALEQLQIGQNAILLTFAILFGGIVIAAAIAFGLGARDLARDWLQERMKRPEPEEEAFHHL